MVSMRLTAGGNMEAIWEEVKSDLKNRISPSGFSLWIEPLQADQGPEGEFHLICPNPFALRWVMSNYLPLIHQVLGQLGHPLSVKLLAARSQPRPPVLPPAADQLRLPLSAPLRSLGRNLNQEFTFSKFVVGGSNRLAYHAAEAVARTDTFFRGILFLTSSPGLGKSHLAQAVGNCLRSTAPQTSVFYVTAEDFANDMVKALRGGQMTRFKEQYRGECEVLLMEEVQFFSGKEKIQAELCYTLDTLLDRRKKLVLTSCYLPGEISQLSQELRSRFTGGLITPIGPPDFPTRVGILSRKDAIILTQYGPELLAVPIIVHLHPVEDHHLDRQSLTRGLPDRYSAMSRGMVPSQQRKLNTCTHSPTYLTLKGCQH